MAKRRPANVTADDILKQMYPDLMTSDDYEQKTEQKTDTGGVDPKVAALEAQLNALQGQIGNLDAANRALMNQSNVDIAPQPPQINYDDAPDPQVDPKGYMEFNQRATLALLDWKEREFEWRQNQTRRAANQVDTLWSDFSSNYGAYAKDSEKVEVAADKVLKRAQAKNVNVDKYMYTNSDKFMADVAKEYDRLFGKPQDADDDDDAFDFDGDGDDRSAGLFSGAGAGPKGQAVSQQEAPQRYGKLSQELMAWQEKTGFKR